MKAVVTILIAVLFVLVLIIDYKLDPNSVPTRIKSFCQAKHDVYGDSIEECLTSYRNHQNHH